MHHGPVDDDVEVEHAVPQHRHGHRDGQRDSDDHLDDPAEGVDDTDQQCDG
ncbi:MAG: hypothetical protein M3Q22_15540 [Actinomycetota bacterium]|nr:hypothetical protein [Actinomycetota bacterium]MDP9461594.1 hypothetical protein [Actinomycetota bacterium]